MAAGETMEWGRTARGAGEPLVASTRDDDCASGGAMALLHDWELKKVQVRMEKVGDPALRDLVDKLMQRAPDKRLPVSAALEHVFFRAKGSAGGGDSQQVLDELKAIREEQQKHTQMLTSMNSKLDRASRQLQSLQLKENDCPRLFVLTEAGSDWRKLLQPQNWLTKTLELRFVCAYSHEAVDPAVEIKQPKDFLRKAGPAVAASLQVLKLALQVRAWRT